MKSLLRCIINTVKSNAEIIFLTADSGFANFKTLQNTFPDRFLNCGISEANMISCAAGIATMGKVPYVNAISAFLVIRAYEQIRNDICMQNLNVKLLGMSAGLDFGRLGPTHHTLEDISLLRTLPNLTILAPATEEEQNDMLLNLHRIPGPTYVRLQNFSLSHTILADHENSFAPIRQLTAGKDITVISYGSILVNVLYALERVWAAGYSVQVLQIFQIKPIQQTVLANLLKKVTRILTVEEHFTIGGIGDVIADFILSNQLPIKLSRMGISDHFAKGYGSHDEIKHMNGLGESDISQKILACLTS